MLAGLVVKGTLTRSLGCCDGCCRIIYWAALLHGILEKIEPIRNLVLHMKDTKNTESNHLSRRNLLIGSIAGFTGAGMLGGVAPSLLGKNRRGINNGRLKQSVVSWCFANHWSLEETCKHAKNLGCGSVELVSSKNWNVLKKYGLTCAIAPIDVEGLPLSKGLTILPITKCCLK